MEPREGERKLKIEVPPLMGVGQIYRWTTTTNRRGSMSVACPTWVTRWAHTSAAAHVASPIRRSVRSTRVVGCGHAAPMPFN